METSTPIHIGGDSYEYEGTVYGLAPGSYEKTDDGVLAAIQALLDDVAAGPPLSMRRAEAKSLIPFDTNCYSSVKVAGLSFPAGHADRRNVYDAILTVLSELPGTPTEVYWDHLDGVTILDVNTLKQIQVAMALLKDLCYQRKRELEAEIDASDEPESVDVTAGWPALPFDMSA